MHMQMPTLQSPEGLWDGIGWWRVFSGLACARFIYGRNFENKGEFAELEAKSHNVLNNGA